MRVIGASWGRTGTTSAAAALDMLGFGPCLQMQDMWEHPELAEVWNRHHRGQRADWTQMLSGYGASVDWPGCWEWQEFAELWPDAHVLLTVREPSSWYDSVVASIHMWTAPGEDVGPPAVAELLGRVWDEDFGGWDQVLDRPRTIALYERHVDDVRATCTPDRLIEWNVADGWQPLCGRLGVEVPNEPVPHLNPRPA
ncbi:MAG: sulfotransferase family protein [Marmoricola sp.]